MAYPDNLADLMATDHEVWNDTETCLYFAKINQKPPTSGQTVTGTLWLSIRKDALKADSLLATMDMTVNLPKANLGTIVPKVNDILQRSDGTQWVIQLAEIVATGNEYRVHVMQSRKGQ